MKRFVLGIMGVAIAVTAMIAAIAPAAASTASGSTTVKWNTQPIIALTLTPNYATGFGQVQATFGTQPTPTHGPNATLDGGAVDFGNIEAGMTYIYKYAAHVKVSSNDMSGVMLYGQGAAAFTNNTDASVYNLNTTLFYANSTSGSPADNNNGFTPGFPFQQTTGIPSGGGYAGPAPTINYGGVFPGTSVGSSSTPSSDFYYDYIMKVPPMATSGQYFVWIVYTAVGN